MPISSNLQKEYFESRRSSLAREIYYGDCLKTAIKKNVWLEYGLLVFAGGTFIGILTTFGIPARMENMLTGAFSLIAFLLSMVQKQWKGAQKIDTYSKFYITYVKISMELKKLEVWVSKDEEFDDETFRDMLASALNARQLIIEEEAKEVPNVEDILRQPKIQERVDRRLLGATQTLEHIPFQDRLRQKEFLPIKP